MVPKIMPHLQNSWLLRKPFFKSLKARDLNVDKVLVVYKRCADIYVYVVGSTDENELILSSVLTCFEESLQALFQSESAPSVIQIDKRTLIDNLDLLLLTVDEIIDDGVILESDPLQVATRVAMRGPDTDVPLAEQTFSQALETARNQLIRSFR